MIHIFSPIALPNKRGKKYLLIITIPANCGCDRLLVMSWIWNSLNPPFPLWSCLQLGSSFLWRKDSCRLQDFPRDGMALKVIKVSDQMRNYVLFYSVSLYSNVGCSKTELKANSNLVEYVVFEYESAATRKMWQKSSMHRSYCVLETIKNAAL